MPVHDAVRLCLQELNSALTAETEYKEKLPFKRLIFMERNMNPKQLNVFKVLLFVAGLAIAGAAFAIINHPMPENGLSVNQKFFWANILVCYIVFFVPFFFSSIKSGKADAKITSAVNVWISVMVFEAAAIVLAVLVLNEKAAVKISFIVEMIVFFLAAIFVYFGYFAGSHIGSVQAQEEKSLSKISELKGAFEMLNLKTDAWSYELDSQKSAVKKLCDDVKYMSPVDSENASKLEMKLIICANVLADSNLPSSEMNSKILELTNLVNQRKLLRK